jgi:hypothetical protein
MQQRTIDFTRTRFGDHRALVRTLQALFANDHAEEIAQVVLSFADSLATYSADEVFAKVVSLGKRSGWTSRF